MVEVELKQCLFDQMMCCSDVVEICVIGQLPQGDMVALVGGCECVEIEVFGIKSGIDFSDRVDDCPLQG